MNFIRKIAAEYRQLPLIIKAFVILAAIVGSVFRYQNLFNLGYYFDMVETQYTWGKLAFEQGVFGFWQNYPMAKHYDYPPISLIYEYFVYAFSKVFSGDGVQNFVTILKSVNWFFDVVMAGFLILFGYFIKNGDREITATTSSSLSSSFQDLKTSSSYFNPASLGWFLASVFYLSPSSWFVSGVWGQNDTLMVLITLLCLWILLSKNINLKSQLNSLGSNFKNPFFLAGVLLAVGFWIKQQPILLVPILGLIFIHKKSNKDIIKAILWVLPFIIISSLLGLFYNSEGREFGNSLNFLTKLVGFDYPMVSNWGIIANLGTLIVFVIPLIILIYLQFKVKKVTAWQDLRRFLLGFWLISAIIAIPFVIANYQRFARVTFAAVIRGDSIAVGATTFWGIFKELKTANDLILGILPLRYTAIIIYLGFIGFLLWKYLKLDLKKLRTLDFSRAEGYQSQGLLLRTLDFSRAEGYQSQGLLLRTLDLRVIFSQKLSLFQLLAIMWLHTTCYFLFFPNMHSRYLHFGIIYSLVVTLFLPLKNRLVAGLWITGLVILNIFYSLNQFLVFGSNNADPSWVKNLIDWFSTGGRNIDAWWLSSFGIFVSFVLMYAALILVEIQQKKVEKRS